jgi:hypothetical protein
MLTMVAYSHRPQSGHLTCYLDRTYHLLPTVLAEKLDPSVRRGVESKCDRCQNSRSK